MAAHSKDREATRTMQFFDQRSKVCLNGAHFYYGKDAEAAYEQAFLLWDGNCYLCGRLVRGKADWEHVIPKGNHGVTRDDHPRNRRFSHRMLDPFNDCHRAKHNREIKWTPRTGEAA